MSGSLFRGFPEARINPLIDLANIGRGERDALGIEQARMQMDADKAFRSVAASAAGGDPNAIRQAIAADPERGIQLQRAIAGMDDRSRQRALENAELVGQGAASLLAMPEDQAAAAYPTVLAGLKSRGLDISGLPPQYPGHERTKAFAAQFQPITQQLQSYGQQVIPVGGAGASGVPRGIRNNNPLNIEAGSFTQSMPGFQGSDGRFAKFETPEQGMAAADALLMRYGMQGRNTIQAIVSKWAPASDGNDVGGYAARVATAMGVRPDEPIPMEDATTRQRLAQAMAAVEVGPRAAQMLVQRGTGLPVTGGAQPGKAWARGPDGNPVQVPIAGAGDPVRPPEGFRGRPDGSLEPIPGGPQDPAYLEQRERTKESGQGFTRANTLRDEFVKLTEPFRTVQSAYDNIQSAAATESGAGDMSMLYSFIKLLDPNSVVRESEFAMAAQSGSFGERMQGAVNRILSGERLPPTLRQEFMNEARNIYANNVRTHDQHADQYEKLAKGYGIDPQTVVTRFSRAAPSASATSSQRGEAAPPGDEFVEERPGPLPGVGQRFESPRGQSIPPLPPGWRRIQ